MKDKIKIGTNVFKTLVAISEDDQARGLMFKPWPPPIMIFPFKKAEVRKFWMKNTISPLDILFCSNNKIIEICHGEPMSTCHVGPDEPVDLVIELPRGTAKKFGMRVGTDVKALYSVDTVAQSLREKFAL